jgi:(p)ppGpp synthase/HD superfamily hydrolase
MECPMTDLVSLAEAFARKAHAGQTRKGAAAEPYTQHLEEVAGFVARHGGDPVAVAVAWLHDTVEDCATETADLVAAFGVEVAAAVTELTDDKALPKAERKRLQVAHASAKSARAALVKLGDKWSNVRALAVSPPRDWDVERCHAYVAWAATVVEALPNPSASALAEFREIAAAAIRAINDRQALAGAGKPATS